MRLVLDASAAMSWILEDERDDLARVMAGIVLKHGAVVPPLFASEIHNVLLVAVRRNRTTIENAKRLIAAVADLPLRFEMRGAELGSSRVIEVAGQCNLSAYDATYIVLAQELSARLMTRDRRVHAAAQKCNVLWSMNDTT